MSTSASQIFFGAGLCSGPTRNPLVRMFPPPAPANKSWEAPDVQAVGYVAYTVVRTRVLNQVVFNISSSIAIRLIVMSMQYFAQRKLQYEPSVENNLDDARACISAGRAASTCPARRTHSDGVVRGAG